MTTIIPGMRIEAGHGENHDTGTVGSIDGDMATVQWDSLVVTECPLVDLRPIDDY